MSFLRKPNDQDTRSVGHLGRSGHYNFTKSQGIWGRFPRTYTLLQTGKVSQVETVLDWNPKTLASSVSYLPYGGITAMIYGNTLSLSH